MAVEATDTRISSLLFYTTQWSVADTYKYLWDRILNKQRKIQLQAGESIDSEI